MFLWIWIFTVIFGLLITIVFLMDQAGRVERELKVHRGYGFRFKNAMEQLFLTLWGLKLVLIILIPIINIIFALLILFVGNKFIDSCWSDIWEKVNKEEE